MGMATLLESAMRILLLTLIMGLCACTSMGSTSTNHNPSARPTSAAPQVGAALIFSAGDIQIIRAYYQNSAYADNGKGKGKSKSLPPGIAKNLQRGKPLPPGIAKRALPYDLKSRLSRPPVGYDRYVVAGKVLLVELGTQIVRDILTDIAFG
jgi:hypothetical protein